LLDLRNCLHIVQNGLTSVEAGNVAGMRFELRLSEHASGSGFVVIEFGLSIMVACPWLGGGRFIYLEDRWTSVVRKLNWSGGWEVRGG